MIRQLQYIVAVIFRTLGIKSASPEVAANTLICLINQASYLLHRQREYLQRKFLEEGGFTERLYRERSKHRH